MDRLDTKSLILGILLSANVMGVYESVFCLLQGKTEEANSAFLAMISTLGITVIYFWLAFLRARKIPPERKNKNEQEKAEETEQEKLRREFQQRMIP